MIQEFRQVMVLSPKRSAVLSKRQMYAEFKSAVKMLNFPLKINLKVGYHQINVPLYSPMLFSKPMFQSRNENYASKRNLNGTIILHCEHI